jgi:glucose-6-phosphate isomerase
MRLGAHAAEVGRRLALIAADRCVERLHRSDPSLWTDDVTVRRAIRDRLGWLRAPEWMIGELRGVEKFVAGVRKDGIRHVVLLGMGGSSLGAEVFRRVFGPAAGHPDLFVLDTTVPAAVRRVEQAIDPARTLFLVSSKSGTTSEMAALQAYFWAGMRRLRGPDTGRHFAAITDPGTPLAEEAAARGYRAAFRNPADIGGRFSALSYFGIVPAALLGIDVGALLRRAVAMRDRCGPSTPASENPGLALGVALGVLAAAGRDKMVVVADRGLPDVILWIEQLIAESTGKEGRGLLPVAANGDPVGRRVLAGPDRFGVGVAIAGSPEARRFRSWIDRPPAPLRRAPFLLVTLQDRLDLGAMMLQWEIATAVAGAVIGVNPFDEPDVVESKRNTEALLAAAGDGAAPAGGGPAPPAGVEVIDGHARALLSSAARPRKKPRGLAGAILALLAGARRGDAVIVLAYVDAGDPVPRTLLDQLRVVLLQRTGVPVTIGCGPRYLHSTGQLHKGGPDNGLFLQVVPADPLRLRVPGAPYDLETLKQAQAQGDFQALVARGRRALRVEFDGEATAALGAVLEALPHRGPRHRAGGGRGSRGGAGSRSGRGRPPGRRAR